MPRRLAPLVALAAALLPSVALADEVAGAARVFSEDVLSRGLLLTYGLAFLYGLGSVLNGCVYPLIPITLTIIGARSAQRRGRNLANAALYVLGMAVMYTSLGLVAALLGKVAGFSFQNPYLMGFVVLVFIAMALSLFGLWELRLPAGWARQMTATRGRYTGIFLMGMVSGIVAAPCTAPFAFNLLAYVGTTRDVALGGSALFVFSLGLGLPFLLLGAFSGAVARLPRSGPWLAVTKYLFGALMLAMAIYYLPYVVGEPLAPVVAGALLVLLGVAGALRRTEHDWSDRALRFGGVAALVAGLAFYGAGLVGASRALFAPHETAAPTAAIAWVASESEALARARAESKPVLLDFWAKWCKPCKEIEEKVLGDPRVVAEARRFVAAKLDCTRTDPAVEALQRKYGVSGLPALVFLDSRGRLMDELTVKERIRPDELLQRMRAVR